MGARWSGSQSHGLASWALPAALEARPIIHTACTAAGGSELDSDAGQSGEEEEEEAYDSDEYGTEESGSEDEEGTASEELEEDE